MAQLRVLDPGASFAACLGAVLRRLRALRGLSQAGLGRLASYDGSYIGAVERAAVRPSRDLVERCDRALQAGGALLALWPLADREVASRALDLPPGPQPPSPGDPGRSPLGDDDLTRRGGLDATWVGRGPGGQAGPEPAPDPVVEAMELARRAEASDVGAGALAGVERAVGRLGGPLPAPRRRR